EGVVPEDGVPAYPLDYLAGPVGGVLRPHVGGDGGRDGGGEGGTRPVRPAGVVLAPAEGQLGGAEDAHDGVDRRRVGVHHRGAVPGGAGVAPEDGEPVAHDGDVPPVGEGGGLVRGPSVRPAVHGGHAEHLVVAGGEAGLGAPPVPVRVVPGGGDDEYPLPGEPGDRVRQAAVDVVEGAGDVGVAPAE